MNAVDTRRLARLEQVIDRGAQTFYEVGHALMQIRDERLFESAGYPNFESYLQAKPHWHFSRTHVFRLIAAVAVVDNLSPTGRRIPNERQARELAALEPEQQRTVWIETQEPGQPPATAERLRELAGRLLDRMTPEQQRDAVEASEKQIMDRDKERNGQAPVDDLESRLAKIANHIDRLRALVGESGPKRRALEAFARVAMPA